MTPQGYGWGGYYTPYAGYTPQYWGYGYAPGYSYAPYPNYYAPPVRKPVPFAPKPVAPSIHHQPEPAKLKAPPEKKPMTPRQKMFLGVSYLAIATSVVGAIALASASLPFQLGKARPMLKKGGLAAISTGLSIGSLGEFGVGLNHKQPTLTFANLVFALAAPIFMKDSRLIRGIFLAMMGSYYAGYASVIGAQNPNAKHTQEAVDHPFRPDNFIKAMVRDHLLVLKAFGRIIPLLGGLFGDVARAAKAVASGERVEIPPSADRVRLSSALHYIGGAVLMILGRKNPKLAALGSGIAAVGGLGSNLEWFAVGTQRNDLVGTALKIGFPMQVVGKATFHTNLGYAVEMAGEGLSYALTSDLNKPK